MSQFKRKGESDGFQAGEIPQGSGARSTGASEPDFSALEAESGTSSGEIKRREPAPAREPEPIFPRSASAGPAEEADGPSRSPFQPSEQTPRRKRYYNPGEVMKQKGCIGCGGMVLVVPFAVAALTLAITIF